MLSSTLNQLIFSMALYESESVGLGFRNVKFFRNDDCWASCLLAHECSSFDPCGSFSFSATCSFDSRLFEQLCRGQLLRKC